MRAAERTERAVMANNEAGGRAGRRGEDRGPPVRAASRLDQPQRDALARPAALSLVGGRKKQGKRRCCEQEQRAHSSSSARRGRTDGGRAAAALTQHFSTQIHKNRRTRVRGGMWRGFQDGRLRARSSAGAASRRGPRAGSSRPDKVH